ncbi:MAG: serine/threonine protein kinase [Acidimicrobiia bacterium]|nr:serine/threonine protein kinase [Acidimicrobiia bacterium]
MSEKVMTCPRCGADVSVPGACPECAVTGTQTTARFEMTGSSIELSTQATSDGATAATMAPPVPSDPRPGRLSTAMGPFRVGQAFGTRYHIIKALGVGGMGAVYQAWDGELQEGVAIKVIRPEVMADPTVAHGLEKRFKRELQLARQVTHKNVVRIHDLGEIDGIKYITMSFVDGTDLSTLLKGEGSIPVERALGIVRGVVEGLLAAHAAGVVHRDLKPANIMIRKDGEALIMDFGIARSTSGAPNLSAPIADLPDDLREAATRSVAPTAAGSVVGTVQYMAPEQAKAQEVDERADQYALGLIFYDMLSGRVRSRHAAPALAR